MGDAPHRLGVLPTYVGYRGDVVPPPRESIEALVGSPAGGRAHRVAIPHREGGPLVCAPAPKHAWGLSVQIYAVRSRQSWGIGDFADLRQLGRWAASLGADVMLVSPLGAQPPSPHQEPCPYYSSSRRFRNLLYLRVDEIPGAEKVEADIAPLRDEALALNAQRHIDHDASFRLKSAALEHVFRADPSPPGLVGWVRDQGRALRDFATFTALSEAEGTAWRNWPARLHHPGGPDVESQSRVLAGRIAFHERAQFHLHRQLTQAGREINPVGAAPPGLSSGRPDRRRRRLGFEARPGAAGPRDPVAGIGTHGLPTVPGIWKLSEPDQRHHHLRQRLVDAAHLPDDADVIDVAVAAYARLATARSRIALASLEDTLGVEERVNVPGTTSEWPNWRLALPHPLEEIERAEGPVRIADVMRQAGRSAQAR